MSDRRGMELAVNTLVVLILGMILVGGGIALVYSIYNAGVKLPEEVGKRTQGQLFDMLLNSDQRIAVLDQTQDIVRGGTATFAVAIQNELEGQESRFRVDGIEQLSPAPASCGTSCPKAVTLDTIYTIPRYDNKAFYVGVHVPKGTPSGEYVFMIKVDSVPDSGPEELYARSKVNIAVE